jgi:hypothetical protein
MKQNLFPRVSTTYGAAMVNREGPDFSFDDESDAEICFLRNSESELLEHVQLQLLDNG